MQKLTPFLWFATEAEEAVAHYLAVFKDGTRGEVRRYPATSEKDVGKGDVHHFYCGAAATHRIQRRGRISDSPKRSPCLSTARHRRKSIPYGNISRPVAKKAAAAGSRTNSACPGKSFLGLWACFCKVKTATAPSGSWMR